MMGVKTFTLIVLSSIIDSIYLVCSQNGWWFSYSVIWFGLNEGHNDETFWKQFGLVEMTYCPCTSLQLSHPKYEFWAAKNVTCLPFSLLFSGHLYKNHSAETWGLGCLFLDYSQPGYLCGLQPTDHYLRPELHQWTHSTALSLFWWPEQPILSENEWWVFFFEPNTVHWRSSFYYPKSLHKTWY